MEGNCFFKENEARKKLQRGGVFCMVRMGDVFWPTECLRIPEKKKKLNHEPCLFAHHKILIWDKLFSERLVEFKACDLVTREYNYMIIHEERNRRINIHPKIF